MIGFIVEGISDVKKINMVVTGEVHFVILNGINFKEEQITQIENALEVCDKLFILTDPDEAGNRVAASISKVFPRLPRIIVSPEKSRVLKKRGYKYGVENCSNKYLKDLLSPYIEPSYFI